MLSINKVFPVVGRKLALGIWQCVLLLALDGPTTHNICRQVSEAG